MREIKHCKDIIELKAMEKYKNKKEEKEKEVQYK